MDKGTPKKMKAVEWRQERPHEEGERERDEQQGPTSSHAHLMGLPADLLLGCLKWMGFSKDLGTVACISR
jgi:hypothetical protein